MREINMTVYGEPIPKGSTRAFVVNGRAIVTNANKRTKGWQEQIFNECVLRRPTALHTGPVGMAILFYLQRPKSVTEAKRPLPTVKPDLDKLVRCCLDAITGVIVRDDAQVVEIKSRKDYCRSGELARVEIKIYELTHREE